MSKLVIVGTVAFDAIETPFGKTDKILGGAATYIGLSSAQFDIDPAIVSVVGGDFLQSDIQMLQSKGINTQGLEVVKEGKTFFWSGKYHNDMNSRDTLATELKLLTSHCALGYARGVTPRDSMNSAHQNSRWSTLGEPPLAIR